MHRTGRSDHTPGLLGAVLGAAAGVILAGCGASTTLGTSGATGAATVAATPSTAVAAAGAAALTIFYALPGQKPEVWFPCSARASNFADCPFSAAVVAGLNHLTTLGLASDAGGCGEDYITGTQNGLTSAPQILSTVVESNGDVTVIIQRGPPPPNFTVTMTNQNGKWVATDLASGTGPSASLFSARPNC